MAVSIVLRHEDGTILDKTGKELILGLDRFKALVKDSQRCFLCGMHEESKPFNDEHIIPHWVQRAYDLRNKKIRLSNETSVRYPKYKIRYCIECNSYLGKTFETPISSALAQGPDAFMQ